MDNGTVDYGVGAGWSWIAIMPCQSFDELFHGIPAV
jgi:hypothetical protein